MSHDAYGDGYKGWDDIPDVDPECKRCLDTGYVKTLRGKQQCPDCYPDNGPEDDPNDQP